MTTTSTAQTQITADPDVPLVRIVREFDAPPAKVFRAHTDPELIVQWLGPRGMQMQVETYDCRTGGSYRYLHRNEQGEFAFHGCFHEVLQHHDELVAGEACAEVVRSQRALDALGDHRQQSVSDRMTQCIVHLFESIQIEQVHRESSDGGLIEDQEGEFLLEHRAIGKVGEFVEVGEPFDLRGRPALLRDVFHRYDRPTVDGRVKPEVVEGSEIRLDQEIARAHGRHAGLEERDEVLRGS